MKKKTLPLILTSLAVNANADIITGDFRNEADLPSSSFSSGPLVYESLGASVGPGFELDAGDFVSNPSSWFGGLVLVDLDPTTNILTLDSQDTGNFETFDFTLTNVGFSSGEVITGVSVIGDDPYVASATVSFTEDSVSISYAGAPQFDFTGDSASFQILTSEVSEIPEPSGAMALGLIFGLSVFGRRRR